MYRVWSINTRNKKVLWLMGEDENLSRAMKIAEKVVLDSNPRVETVNFEQSHILEKTTNSTKDSVICYSPDEVVGSVITGPDLDLDYVSGLLPP